MGYPLRWLRATILAVVLLQAVKTRGAEPTPTNQAASASTPSLGITRASVLKTMKRVADWQLANPSAHPATDWTQGAYYAGMMALASISDDPKYHDAMMEMAQKNQWKPSTNLVYHADNY